MKTTKVKNKCEKYELAITNYVIGEEIDIPQKELFEHLARCRSCQGDLRNWRATYATMRAKEYDQRPEVKKQSQAFIKELVNMPLAAAESGIKQPIPKTLPPVIDSIEIVGTAAGKIYRCLKANGPMMSISALRQETGFGGYPLLQALGWLEREDKIITRGTPDQPEYVELKPGM